MLSRRRRAHHPTPCANGAEGTALGGLLLGFDLLRFDPKGGDDGRSPIEVASDASLSLEARRSILMNWAYTEYLQDVASTEGMPENQRASQFAEVERALLALEAAVAADGLYPSVEEGRAA